MRFSRDYILTIGIGGRAIIIQPPHRIAFDFMKSEAFGVHKMNLKVWNLSPLHREQLLKDEWGDDSYLPLELSIGYRDNLKLLMRGNVRKGEFDREGAEFVSSLEVWDGGYAKRNGFTNSVVQNKIDEARALLAGMPSTGEGKISTAGEYARPKILIGNSFDLLKKANPSKAVFIDNEQLFVLDENEPRDNYAPLVSAQTGLLNTPKINKGVVTFSTLMNPDLRLGGLCKLDSVSSQTLNGVYKIFSIHHKGDTDGNDWMQTIEARRI